MHKSSITYAENGRCMYKISDEFSRVAVRDLNMHDVHLFATHKYRTCALFNVDYAMEDYMSVMSRVTHVRTLINAFTHTHIYIYIHI